MRAIVAVDNRWGIGKNNCLLFSLKEDMKFFREQTIGKVVVMGRKTLESFPNGKPLKNRVNIVLTNGGACEGCISVSGLDGLFETLKSYNTDDVYVIGGASVYKTLLPYCDEALVTKVDADGGAEAFFDDLDAHPDWRLEQESKPIDDNGFIIRFCRYKNIK